jgi:nitrogen fixation protein FixH
MILAIFGLLFVATYHTFKVALSAPNELVDKDYYQVGLNYEKKIANIKKLKAEGYQFTVFTDLDNLKKGINSIQIRFAKEGQIISEGSIKLKEEKLSGKKIQVLLERGATDKYNKAFILTEDSPGIYSGNLDIPDSGKWILTIASEEDSFMERKTIIVN